ncbi:MAG: hypothetical protein IKV97_05620 [Clostridia bacterium]|nr:hypothetical protein [Clostridia bacterium]
MNQQNMYETPEETEKSVSEVREMYLEESRPINFYDVVHLGYPSEKCMYCGYEILPGECKAQVNATGDVIHKKCWQDYADDNFYELCCVLSHYDGADTEEEYI